MLQQPRFSAPRIGKRSRKRARDLPGARLIIAPAQVLPAKISTLFLVLLFSVLEIIKTGRLPHLGLFASAVDVPVVALSLPAAISPSGQDEDVGDSGDGYIALSQALGSVVKLAVEDVNTAAAGRRLLGTGSNLSLTMVEASSATSAVQSLCNVLTASGGASIYGVSFLCPSLAKGSILDDILSFH